MAFHRNSQLLEMLSRIENWVFLGLVDGVRNQNCRIRERVEASQIDSRKCHVGVGVGVGVAW